MLKLFYLTFIIFVLAALVSCQPEPEETPAPENPYVEAGATEPESSESPAVRQGAEALIGNWQIEWQFDEGQNFMTPPLNMYISLLHPSEDVDGIFLGTGCLYSGDTESMMPLSMEGVENEMGGFDLRIVSTIALQEEGYLILLFNGSAAPDASTGVVSMINGEFASMHGPGAWKGDQLDQEVIECPDVRVMEEVYTYDVYAHSNVATDPPVYDTLLESITVIASTALRAETPDGEEIVVEEYTDIFSPDVDFIDSFRYLVSPHGQPTVGQPYKFTLLDVLGNPIPGTQVEDIWYACSQAAAENLQAVFSPGEYINLTWDAVDIVPNEFEPAADPQIGEYKLNVSPIHPEGPTTFGASGIASPQHIVPWEPFEPGLEGEPDGYNFGVSLSELQDGVYEMEVETASLPSPEDQGVRFECFVRDRSQNLLMKKVGTEINFIHSGFISGVVQDIKGNPIEGIFVVACEYEADEPYCMEGVSNADGMYTIFSLLPGEYRVGIFEQPGWMEQIYDGRADVNEADRVVVESGSIIDGIDFALLPQE